uniref:Putative c-3 sterol dehydrogenase/3-beta-hydroxysteroid dehydrogenase n=1 Tax=Anopheles marajoara TaxID=58244 RepID=A0A2M4BQW7_9DIPT
MSKPNVLVLGGCGFIGRHLVHYLVTNDLAARVKVVDKTPPLMAWLNRAHSVAFADERVEFTSANLINPASCQNAFRMTEPAMSMTATTTPVTATGGESRWDFVINCAAETKPGQTDPVYEEGILKLSINCATEAIKQGAKRYVELSTASMCSDEKVPQKEDCPVEPWTMVGKYKAKVERELMAMEELPYTILRIPICYGVGDRKGLTPRLIIAGIYKHLGETMKLLWTGTMKMNVVHVEDVCGSIWELLQTDRSIRQIVNVCDDSDATQATISELLADIFGIEIDYWGITMSNMTKLDMAGAIEEINDRHLGPWAEVCTRDGVLNTPLTPYMDQELLLHKHVHLSNEKLKSYGYQLRRPRITRESLEEIVKDFIGMNHFPRTLLN